MRDYVKFLAAAGLFLAVQASAQDGSGQQVYEKWCAMCHLEGIYMGGTLALQAKYQGVLPAVLIERTDLTPELIKQLVRSGVGIMAPFRKTEISDDELEALASFLAEQR